MDRDAGLTVGVAVLAVLAVAVAAATLDTAVVTDAGGGFGGGQGSGVGSGESGGFGLDRPNGGGEAGAAFPCFPWLRSWPVLLGMAAVLAVAFAGGYYDSGSTLAGGAVSVAVGLPLIGVWALFAFCDSPGAELDIRLGSAAGNQSLLPVGGGRLGLEGAGETVTAPSAMLTVLLVVAIAAALGLFVLTGRDDRAISEPAAEASVALAAVGRAAGAAADRLEATEDAETENEVYRAWREMTEHLDVDSPASSTPAEFAAAAIEAGMDQENVTALTRLFEDVRYGAVEPTPDRERRAVETLRQIEASYDEEAT